MPDTANRPTPEQIADDCRVIAVNLRSEGSFFAECRAERLEQLAQMLGDGAVIVRVDDVPGQATAEAAWGPAWAEGWNACRAHIFGDDQ